MVMNIDSAFAAITQHTADPAGSPACIPVTTQCPKQLEVVNQYSTLQTLQILLVMASTQKLAQLQLLPSGQLFPCTAIAASFQTPVHQVACRAEMRIESAAAIFI